MVDGFEFKENYSFNDLIKIVEILRSPNGCPWDREQTHKSIRANFIEETYEAIEAIDTEDTELLREELGDVLLQVALHTEMEREKGTFNIIDVTDGICKKLIVRHPHVFGDVKAESSEEVLKNWDAIKKRVKGQNSHTETLKSVPSVLPALMRSLKVQQRASRAGFDWPDSSGAVAKVHEELAELEQAMAQNNKAETKSELGDLLFSVVNLARFIGAEPEESLTDSCNKFIRRFALCEEYANKSGQNLAEMSVEELEGLWVKAKAALQFKPE